MLAMACLRLAAKLVASHKSELEHDPLATCTVALVPAPTVPMYGLSTDDPDEPALTAERMAA